MQVDLEALYDAERSTGIDGGDTRELGLLPPDFWTRRPYLEHIHQAAQARRVAPGAVLGATLARAAAMVPPSTRVPPFVGGAVPLSLYVALMSATGGGKSSPVRVAGDLLPDLPDWIGGPLPLGSGEGIARSFMGEVDTVDDGKTVKRPGQVRYGVVFDLDEGRTLSEMASRRGSTLAGALCTAWTGGELGQANATRETYRHVPAGAYSIGLVSAWQPRLAAELFDEEDGGLPGRFLYVATSDPDAPDRPPAWPGRLHWEPPPLIASDGRVAEALLGYSEAIRAEVDADRLARLRSERTVQPLDAHRVLHRLKLAGLLAVLDGRSDVDDDDWDLAGGLLRASDLTRADVLTEISRTRSAAERTRLERAARHDEHLESSREQRAFDSAVRAVARKAHKTPSAALTRSELTRAIKGDHRKLINVDEVLERAELEDYITPNAEPDANGRPRYRAGDKQPA